MEAAEFSEILFPLLWMLKAQQVCKKHLCIVEEVSSRQGSVVRSPKKRSWTEISEYKSTIQSGTSTQNAGESLVNLTINPNSLKGQIGLALVESRSFVSSSASIDKGVDDKTLGNEDMESPTQ